MTILLLCFAVALVITAFALWLRDRTQQQRAQLLTEILDLADALERELLECRTRLREIPALTAKLPPSDDLSARSTLAAEPQVQDALRDLLAHRLWLKENAENASRTELQTARDALASTRAALATQLSRLAGAKADFEQTRDALRLRPLVWIWCWHRPRATGASCWRASD